MQHFNSYNIRKKALLERKHDLFRYGYFEKGLKVYRLKKQMRVVCRVLEFEKCAK